MKIEYQDSIDRFLLNRMSDEERKSFEARCAENEELKDQFEHTKKVRTVISARSRILEMVQKWDEEYDAEEQAEKEKRASRVAREKRLIIYWLSGIAAVFVVGFFLSSTITFPDSDEIGNNVSLNHKNNETDRGDSTIDSLTTEKGEENLLAKNELGDSETKDVEKEEHNQVNQKVISNTGNDNIVMSSSTDNEKYEMDLQNIEAELQKIAEETKQNESKFASKSIDQDIYDTTAKLLKYQADQLLWKKVQILLVLSRTEEAISMLEEMRKARGKFQRKSDSLYHELKK